MNEGQAVAGSARYNGHNGAGALQQGANRDTSLVERAQNSLDSAVATLHGVISGLESRLTTLLAQVPVGKGVGGDTVSPHSVAERIECSGNGVLSATARLQELINRLEV